VAKKKILVSLGISRTFGRTDTDIAFLLERYVELHPDCLSDDGAFDAEHFIEWVFSSPSYKPEPMDPREQLRKKVNRHLGHRYLKDPKGRTVRALVAVPREITTQKGVRKTFRYFPLYDTQDIIIAEGLDLRRRWAGKRVEQIETDRVSYNEFNTVGGNIPQMSFDFDATLAENAMPTKYPKKAPDDIDEEDDSLD
jgi:hypothetical protein